MRFKNFLNLVALVGISFIILSLKHSENFSQESNVLINKKVILPAEFSFVGTKDDFYYLEKKERSNIYESSLKNKFISSRAKPHLLKGNTGNIEK
ncbi:MAG: hypothetical protein WHT45_02460 [Ignavibacterium sp.]